ncbi:hypothetical protein ACFXA0_32755 [Streptomyces cyaneofuscatus]|uniref:hypothetical protein n=1 Tax=Streptomyces cyaneofuscatus TaxID=66883 RepID=UPI0036C8580A
MTTPPQAQIFLSLSPTGEITAIAHGTQYRWAHTALEQSGFRRHQSGRYVLAAEAGEPDRKAAAGLVRLAARHSTTVHVSSRPYLGHFGDQVAAYLPGNWSSELEVYSHPLWQEDLVPLLWDAGELSPAVCNERIPYAVTLKEPSGIELLLVERPGAQQGYFVGALMTRDYERNYDTPYAPAGIALGSSPGAAARDIAHRFLPAYRRALHQRRVTTVADALDSLRAGHRTLVSANAGSPPALPSRSEEQGVTKGRLWLAFQDVLVHAPGVLARCDAAVSAWPGDGAALSRLREALAAGQDALAEWTTQQDALVRISPALREPPSDLRTRLALQVMSSIETWLADGDAFVRQALAVVPGRTLALSPGRDSTPQPAVARPKLR